MNYEHKKSVYTISCILLCLIFLSPTLVVTLPPPGEEKFSTLWILGPDHMMEGYPSNVIPGQNYHLFLGVGNQMGGLEYYLIKVKLANQSDPLPTSSDNLTRIPSSLSSVYEYRLFLQKNATWEKDFSFAFNDVSYQGNTSRISTISIDGNPVKINKIAVKDSADNEYHFELFFELWIYNFAVSTFQFHNRSVGLRMNVNR